MSIISRVLRWTGAGSKQLLIEKIYETAWLAENGQASHPAMRAVSLFSAADVFADQQIFKFKSLRIRKNFMRLRMKFPEIHAV